MFAPPDPKKVAYLRRQAQRAEKRRRQEDAAYREHLTGQRRFELAVAREAGVNRGGRRRRGRSTARVVA